MKFRKIAALALAAVMTVSAAATASAAAVGANEDPANTEKTDETITIALASEPATLAPSLSGTAANEAQIVSSTYMDTLVRQDMNTGEVLPGLATEWEWVDDTHCKFTIRDDAKCYNGDMLTADDVAWCINDVWVALNATNDTGMFVAGAEADGNTVTIEFNLVSPALLGMLSWTNFNIMSQADVEAAGGMEQATKTPFIGTGPYRFVEWKNTEYIKVERNEDYWDPDYNGYFKEIVFKFIGEPASREANVESGDVDVAADMPVIQASAFVDSENVKTVLFNYGQNGHLWYNMTEGHPTADVNVRKAIDLALDFDNIAIVGTAGTAPAATGYIDEGFYHNDTYTAEERAVNIEEAKALLEEAGYGDGLTLSTTYMQETETVHAVIKECLRQIGIDLVMNPTDVPTFVQTANSGDYDIMIIGEWMRDRIPSAFPFIRWDNIHGFHMGGPQTTTDELDGLVHDFISEQDDEKAKEILTQIEQIMKDDCIVSNLYPEVKAAILNKDLKGFTTLERGYINPINFYK